MPTAADYREFSSSSEDEREDDSDQTEATPSSSRPDSGKYLFNILIDK